MRSFIQLGFMATAGATLPPLLSLFPFPIREDWRVASAGISLWLGIWSVTFRHRRNLVSKVHAPRPIYVVIVIFWLTTITLLANAVLAPERFMAGLYSAAVTIILAGGATFLMMSLIYLVDQPIEHVHRRPQQGG